MLSTKQESVNVYFLSSKFDTQTEFRMYTHQSMGLRDEFQERGQNFRKI